MPRQRRVRLPLLKIHGCAHCSIGQSALPNLAPSQQLVNAACSSNSASAWAAFVRKFRAEMNKPEASRVLDVLAALSHSADFSVGCYCVGLR